VCLTYRRPLIFSVSFARRLSTSPTPRTKPGCCTQQCTRGGQRQCGVGEKGTNERTPPSLSHLPLLILTLCCFALICVGMRMCSDEFRPSMIDTTKPGELSVESANKQNQSKVTLKLETNVRTVSRLCRTRTVGIVLAAYCKLLWCARYAHIMLWFKHTGHCFFAY
jgi:hypothetical protein